MPTNEDRPASDWSFATTGWTLVFSAVDVNNQPAREQFARLYWFPLYAFARRRGNSPEDAEDAVQSAVAARMDMDEGSLRNMVPVFRRRFRALFRQYVAATLSDSGRVDDEIRDLLAALSK